MSALESPGCALEPRLRRAAALGELAAALAHEMSNVHMVATGNLELLLATEAVPPAPSALAKSRDAIWRGAEILRTLMALAQGEEAGGGARFAIVLNQVRVLVESKLKRLGLGINEDLVELPRLDIDPAVLALGLYGFLLGLGEASRRGVLTVRARVGDAQVRCELSVAGNGESVPLLAEVSRADDAGLGRVDTGLARRALVAAGATVDVVPGSRLVIMIPVCR